MPVNPHVNNYLIGKGNVYFTPEGGTRRHLGNVSAFEANLEVEELDHFSSMEGVRTRDLSVVVEKTASVRLVLDEWSAANIELAMLGETDPTPDTDGNTVIEIFATDKIRGRLEFEASNDVGPKINYDFHSVAFRPDAAINPISEEWATLEIIGEIEFTNGSWGTATIVDPNTETE